ncbi:MAG TPA: ABC transporter permease [Terriglobales bacterium]|nr:ABC transporter permease [Terriglobales bacterium]
MEKPKNTFDPKPPHYAALKAFGNATQIKEATRGVWTFRWLEELGQDLRYALRSMRKSPAVAAVVVLSLALGIGANTAIFSLIDAVMLRFLPVQKPQELVLVRRQLNGGRGSPSFTNPLWEALRDRQDVFSAPFAWSTDRYDLGHGGAVQNANGLVVSGGYFQALGVTPVLGRLISQADDHRGCPAVAVLSYGFWQDHFGGATSVIGQSISLDQQSLEIIGVSARGFYGLDVGSKFDVALPLCATTLFDGKESRLDQRSWWWLMTGGRLKPGVSEREATARLTGQSPVIMNAALPPDWSKEQQQRFLSAKLVSSSAATGVSALRNNFGQPLTILMTIVAAVLLIACANIASLMLARATTRTKEMAIRKAMGASRSRLTRQLLTESLLLSAVGAVCGLLFARWGSALLVRSLSTTRSNIFLDLTPDSRVLAFTAGLAIVTGLLVGVLPALRSTRVALIAAMKGSQDSEGAHVARFRAGKWIVAGQVALSLVLVLGGGLLLRSFYKLVTLDLGFDRNNVLLVRASLQTDDNAKKATTYVQMEDRLRSLPGVTAVSHSFTTPLSGREWNNFIHPDAPNPPTGEEALAFLNAVTPDYFDVLRTPLLAGRQFTATDSQTAPPVAIVNQTFAKRFFGGKAVLGKQFRIEGRTGQTMPLVEIVGVVEDSKYEDMREEPQPTGYFPLSQTPQFSGDNFELRTNMAPSAMAAQVQTAVAGVNKEVTLAFTTLTQQVDDNLVQDRLLAKLSGFFGALALLLAMIGSYGVLSFMVTQRQTEFGIRMALGAQPTSILRLVMSDMLAVLIGGIAVGIGLSLATVRLLQKMLFGLSPHDATTMLIATGVLAAAGVLAGLMPARRATRVDPMVTLRYE